MNFVFALRVFFSKDWGSIFADCLIRSLPFLRLHVSFVTWEEYQKGWNDGFYAGQSGRIDAPIVETFEERQLLLHRLDLYSSSQSKKQE